MDSGKIADCKKEIEKWDELDYSYSAMSGQNILHRAVMKGDISMVKLLINKKYDLSH